MEKQYIFTSKDFASLRDAAQTAELIENALTRYREKVDIGYLLSNIARIRNDLTAVIEDYD